MVEFQGRGQLLEPQLCSSETWQGSGLWGHLRRKCQWWRAKAGPSWRPGPWWQPDPPVPKTLAQLPTVRTVGWPSFQGSELPVGAGQRGLWGLRVPIPSSPPARAPTQFPPVHQGRPTLGPGPARGLSWGPATGRGSTDRPVQGRDSVASGRGGEGSEWWWPLGLLHGEWPHSPCPWEGPASFWLLVRP